MGLNVEAFFAQTAAIHDVREVIRKRLASPPDRPGMQPDWGLHSSYDVLLASELKRKIAISPPSAGWVAGVESKEVVDFGLMQQLATVLCTKVIAVQVSEGTGCCGYALCDKGFLAEHRFSEVDEDPARTVAKFLEARSVPFHLFTFREAVQSRWELLATKGP